MRPLLFAIGLWVTACGGRTEVDAGLLAPNEGGPTDGGVDGVVFVHGVHASAENWAVMVERFRADGWPAERLLARSFDDPKWGCNVNNAERVSQWVDELAAQGARRIAVVAHSMGGLSSRYFLKRHQGTRRVAVLVTLGTMHHGLAAPCLAGLPVCTWTELCSSGPFLADLNAPSATPGPTRWVSIYSDTDETVPAESSRLGGAENVELHGLSHDGPNGLQDSAQVYQRVRQALR